MPNFAPATAIKFDSNTALGQLFVQVRGKLSEPVPLDYLHMSTTFINSMDMSPQQEQIYKSIVDKASKQMAKVTSVRTGSITVEDNGYVKLEVISPEIDNIIEEMHQELLRNNFPSVNKKPMHITLRAGVFGTKLSDDKLLELRAQAQTPELQQLTNKSFSLAQAQFGAIAYKGKQQQALLRADWPHAVLRTITPTPKTPQAGLIPFQVDFGKVPHDDAKRQAKEILDEVNRLHKLGAKTVGITYSANQGQTDHILDTYQKGKWKTGTKGSNQADVISEIEKLLETEYQHLQQVYRTVPITTMKYVGIPPNKKAVAADDDSVRKSLHSADQFISEGGVLLGWRNQFTKPGKLAIGGGIADKVQTATQKQMIDSWIQKHLMPKPVAAVEVEAQKTPHSTPAVDDHSKEKPHTTAKNKSVFAFDIDDTLIQAHSFHVKDGPKYNKKEMTKIKAQMAEAIKNGHEVWIVTANWGYTKEQMKILFAPDPDKLLDKIKFFNGHDIGRELKIPPYDGKIPPEHKLQRIHSQGLKGKFLAQQIAKDPDLKDCNVNCVLFDDTQAQIDNCAANSTDKIKIEGVRVDDYRAIRKVTDPEYRPKPESSLSEVLAERVSKVIDVHAKKTPGPVVTDEVIEMRNRLVKECTSKIEKIKVIRTATVYAQALSQSEKNFMDKSCNKLIKTLEQGIKDINSSSVPEVQHAEIGKKIGKHLDGILKESKNIARTSGLRGFINNIFEALGFTKPFTIAHSATIGIVAKMKSQLITIKDEEVLEHESVLKKDR